MSSACQQQRGVCIWLTGLSGAGKSTIANALVAQLHACSRQTTLLDGDIIRTHLSKGLGFSREDRDTNILRIGFVAGEVVKHGGAAVCAVISPYRAARDAVRGMLEEMEGEGSFVEVFVDTPIEVCERRDVKGLYARARRGELKNFTGVNDPYEPPVDPELILHPATSSSGECVRQIMGYLAQKGFVVME